MWAHCQGGTATRAAALAQAAAAAQGDAITVWHSTSPCMLPTACPDPYPLLILPGDATQASVELQVLLGCQLIKECVKLGAVAQALLDLQELLQDAVGED